MSRFIIAPSVLSADWARLGQEAQDVLDAGADFIHVDVMDNHFVPNLTLGPQVVEALRRYGVQAPIDVHLMIEPVDQIIPEFARAGASYISIHPEASAHLDRSLQLIRDAGCRAGVALNPATPLTCLDYVWNKIDLVLVMSVNPGFGGQTFLPSALDKLRALRERIGERREDLLLQVDGGVTAENIGRIAEAGADAFVAGTAVFGCEDRQAAIAGLRARLPQA